MSALLEVGEMASWKVFSQGALPSQSSRHQFCVADTSSLSSSKLCRSRQCRSTLRLAHFQSRHGMRYLEKQWASELASGGPCLKAQFRLGRCAVSSGCRSVAARRTRATSTLLEMVPEVKKESLIYDLPWYDPAKRKPLDLVVVGAGPAGLAVAQQVSKEGLGVCVIDPSPQSIWPNNYGVWVDEFEAMDLLDCLDHTWSSAVVYLDDNNKKSLDRPYGRVNRKRLKSKMLEQCIANGVQFYPSKVRHGQ